MLDCNGIWGQNCYIVFSQLKHPYLGCKEYSRFCSSQIYISKRSLHMGEPNIVDGGVSRLWTRPVNHEDLSPGPGRRAHIRRGRITQGGSSTRLLPAIFTHR